MHYRVSQERLACLSVSIIDSQSIKNSEWTYKRKIFDGYKRIQGRKRHIIVDTLGSVIAVKVTPANIPDSKVALQLCQQMQAYPVCYWLMEGIKEMDIEVKVVKRNEITETRHASPCRSFGK
jgi:hypothetical protein